MRTLKIFIIGPHNRRRYTALKDYVENFIERNAVETSAHVITPIDNPLADRFNDWIFGQIDTCDLLIADMTNFNPNVVYEVAFAHTLGTPCVYLQFRPSATESRQAEDISHYFKFSLINEADEEAVYSYVDSSALNTGNIGVLDEYLTRILSGIGLSGETILSDYYGAYPADAEFMRGLAEGYFRNFLGFILEAKPPPEFENLKFKIIIPDTFEVTDGHIDNIKTNSLGKDFVPFPEALNSLGRPLGVNKSNKHEDTFFFDIPSTILTITSCSKYKKIQDGRYFSSADRDALTDRLARKFVEVVWQLLKDNRRSIKFPTSQLEFVWLSEIVSDWHSDGSLLNDAPFARPEGF